MTPNGRPDSTESAKVQPTKANKQQSSNGSGSVQKQELKILMLHGTYARLSPLLYPRY